VPRQPQASRPRVPKACAQSTAPPASEAPAENELDKLPWQAMQQRHHWRAHQHQKRSDRHQQQMLNHMDRQQFLVECSERRAYCDPDQKESEEKN